jgi:hypothetical protein
VEQPASTAAKARSSNDRFMIQEERATSGRRPSLRKRRAS